ncbi:hypothetical protein AFGD_002061 [Aspergillus flavus]|nr:hypothetical protein AFGD_002061 [Aspergillus flavus]
MRERFLAIGKEEKPQSSTLEIVEFKLMANYSLRSRYMSRGINLDGLLVCFKLGDDHVRDLTFGIQAEPTDPCYTWLGLFRRPIASSILSESGISRMREMVEPAISRSDLGVEGHYLPTRLIYVGDEQHKPRLVVSKTHPPFLKENEGRNAYQYVALSYCWGSRIEAEQQLKTTRDSFECHMQEIPIEALPQTLLDAILVCRALGVQYLWVDVLCIIQGDRRDWERESANMANVYSHSFLTVCAAQGDSCQSGFLKRHPPSQVEIPFQSSLDPSVSGRYSLKEVSGLLSFRNDDGTVAPSPFRADVAYTSWNSRGWTFQEVKLSPRALIFGTCMTHICYADFYESEDGDRHPSKDVMGPSLSLAKNFHLHAIYSNMRPPLTYSDWYPLVELYTSRSLTYHEDVLVAISAIAEYFSTELSGKYLAGLWSDDLLHGLLWRSTGPNRDNFDMNTTYTAPSWSWACQSFPVNFHKGHGRVSHEAKVLTAETSFTASQYGQVTDGFVLLSAKACKIPPARFVTTRSSHSKRNQHKVHYGIEEMFDDFLFSNDGKSIAYISIDQRYKPEEHLIDRMSMVLVSSDWRKC